VKPSSSSPALVLLATSAALACSDSDVTHVREPAGATTPGAGASDGSQPGDSQAEGPLYALLSIVFDDEDNATSYIVLTDTPDVSELSLDSAREFSGRVNIGTLGGELFVASDEDLNVTRYAISRSGEWTERGRVSFQNQGLEGWQVRLQSLVGDDMAYMPLDITGRLLWSPTRLELLGSRAPSSASASKNGLEGYCSGWGFDRRQGAPVFVCSYNGVEDYHDRGDDVEVVVYDPVSHEQTSTYSIGCPGVQYSSQDEAGNSYLANWDYYPTRALYGLARPPCVRRLLPDGSLDQSWTPDFTQWTGGRHVMNWKYVRDGKAIGNVLHHEQLGSSFTGAIDPDVQDAIENGEHYRPWLFDLQAQTATPIDGFADLLWALPLQTVDGREFAMLPYDSYGRTEIYEIGLDGTARRHLDVTGYVEAWLRVR
jgi:hypothetical protein